MASWAAVGGTPADCRTAAESHVAAALTAAQLEAAAAVGDGHFEALALAAGRLGGGEGEQAR
ncbi:hypothetical protein ABZ504_47410, partial [Streptomyces mirabilis]|uniref:hypothetical protein n=1 Tax=Streptomyces mirabilis TaxID=68239 RepID=UPI0034109367